MQSPGGAASETVRLAVLLLSLLFQTYEEDVLEWLETNGFNTTISSARDVYQESDCLYVDP